jgi:hypothetical protein
VDESHGVIIIINVIKPERTKALVRPRHRWLDNIKMDLGEMVWPGLVWYRIGQVEGSCECSIEPSN